MEYIGLRNENGNIEYNARFLIGHERAELLEYKKWYTFAELQPAHFINTHHQNTNKHKHKWRRVDA